MSDNERLRLLRAQPEDDYRFIVDCAQRHAEMVSRASQTDDEEMATAAVAYLVHNLYTAFEGYFLRVAKCFENSMGDSSWHRESIDRMKIAIPGIRPAVISAELAEPLDELRRFRHLFRNLYKSRLKKHRVAEISEIAAMVSSRFGACHDAFVAWIDALLAAEESNT